MAAEVRGAGWLEASDGTIAMAVRALRIRIDLTSLLLA
jgi:hypothetical protein